MNVLKRIFARKPEPEPESETTTTTRVDLATYRRVGYYRGVRFEYRSHFPPNEHGAYGFVGGGPPEFGVAVRKAERSLESGRTYARWLADCVSCGHEPDEHDEDGCQLIVDEMWWDDGVSRISCECERFVRRAPLVVA